MVRWVQENTADDLRELDERVLQTAAALNMSAQQGRQQMQRDIDRDLRAAFNRLGMVEDVVGGLAAAAGDTEEAESERAIQVRECNSLVLINKLC